MKADRGADAGTSTSETCVYAFENEDIRDFFENAALALHWVGADGTILRANRCELEFLGYSREEYEGHHIAEFHVDRHVIEDILARLTNGETVIDYEARLRAKDGSIKYVLINSNVRWRDGKFLHTRCFTRDITDYRLAEQEMQRRAMELNDDVIQDVVAAKMWLEMKRPDRASSALERALASARSIVAHLLSSSGSAAGSFVRNGKE